MLAIVCHHCTCYSPRPPACGLFVLARCQGIEPATGTGVPELLAQRWFVVADRVPPHLSVVEATFCGEASAVRVVRADGAAVPPAEAQVEHATWYGLAAGAGEEDSSFPGGEL